MRSALKSTLGQVLVGLVKAFPRVTVLKIVWRIELPANHVLPQRDVGFFIVDFGLEWCGGALPLRQKEAERRVADPHDRNLDGIANFRVVADEYWREPILQLDVAIGAADNKRRSRAEPLHPENLILDRNSIALDDHGEPPAEEAIWLEHRCHLAGLHLGLLVPEGAGYVLAPARVGDFVNAHNAIFGHVNDQGHPLVGRCFAGFEEHPSWGVLLRLAPAQLQASAMRVDPYGFTRCG